jgi:hypothetical protein
MSDRTLHCYDYVNQPYPRVRDALLADPYAVLQRATAAATTHAATLHVRFGGIDIGTDVAIQIANIEHDDAYGRPATKLTLAWQAAHNPRMFPAMHATLVIFGLSATETQLEFQGTYQPPLGKLGEVVDAAAGHRFAEASMTRFIQEVAGWLREELAGARAVPAVDTKPAPEVLAVPGLFPSEPVTQPGASVDQEC